MTARADSQRLPGDVLPRHYDLSIAIDIAAGTFEGTVGIDVDLTRPTTGIVLHSLGLDLLAATVTTRATTQAAEPLLDEASESVTLCLPEELAAGSARIDMGFRGTLGDQLVGLYRSSFTTDGEEHSLAVTQFQSTHARRAFPCFDEPAFKATFAVSLTVAEGLFVVSNAAEVARTSLGDGRDRVDFATTMLMSTYLVAFVVGPLEATEVRVVAGRDAEIPLRVVHPPGQSHLCGFALDVADGGLRFFEDYYDLPYPADKVDLVAVPDFAFGAMENTGCIIFREVALLVDTATATPREAQYAALVINHELAHMWFGNLVTMKWWNGIWLNEAFATFMEVAASDAFRPSWDSWTNFGHSRATAFDTDSLRSTRPVEYEVVTAEDAEGMFDVLTYEKGGSVVRMLEQYLGAEVFRDGIRAYLRRHAHANTETTDLWDALEEVSGEPVRRIMDRWIFRGGHPVVRAVPTEAGVDLSQGRAAYPLPAGAVLPAGDTGSTTDTGPWPVPVVMTVRTSDTTTSTHRLLLEEPTSLHLDGSVVAVQPNVGGNGFYRSQVDRRSRRGIAAGGTSLERFTLLDDTWFAVVCGDLGTDAIDEVITELAAATTETPLWRRISTTAAEWHRLSGPEGRPHVAAFVRRVAGPVAERFPVDHGRQTDSAEIAGVLFTLLGTTGEDAAVRSAARSLFARHDLHPAVAAAALDVVAATASADEHAEILLRWTGATTPQEEQRHMNALVTTDDPTLFAHALGLLDEVRSQDAPFLLRRALANPVRGADAWEFVASNWAQLVGRLPSSGLPRMLEGIRGFTDPALATGVAAFLDVHPLDSGQMQVRQHVERMWASVGAADRLQAAAVADD